MSCRPRRWASKRVILIGIGGTGAKLAEQLITFVGTNASRMSAFSLVACGVGGVLPELPAVHVVDTDQLNVADAAVSICDVDKPFTKERIAQILKRPNQLYAISPLEFESFVAEIYRGLGYEVVRTKRSYDGGIDLIIEKHADGMRQRYVVQCKHSRNPSRRIGVAFVRELRGVLATCGATAAILVTNVTFSACAMKLLRDSAFRMYGIAREQLLALIGAYFEATAH